MLVTQCCIQPGRTWQFLPTTQHTIVALTHHVDSFPKPNFYRSWNVFRQNYNAEAACSHRWGYFEVVPYTTLHLTTQHIVGMTNHKHGPNQRWKIVALWLTMVMCPSVSYLTVSYAFLMTWRRRSLPENYQLFPYTAYVITATSQQPPTCESSKKTSAEYRKPLLLNRIWAPCCCCWR